MNKEIIVRLYEISRNDILSMDVPVNDIYTKNSFDSIDGFGIDGEIYIPRTPGQQTIRITTNDMELSKGELLKQTTVSLNILDMDNCTDCMPELGINTDTNIDICQFNADTDIIFGLFGKIMFWWDIDKIFHYGGDSLTKEKLENEIHDIQRIGYGYPTVMYADSAIRPYCFESSVYISKILGKKTTPIRLMCYKDHKYLESINEYIYNKVKNIPENKFYVPLDNEDVSAHFVLNYSDKRKIISKYINEIPLQNIIDSSDSSIQFKLFPIEKYTVILPFIFDEEMETENEKMLVRIRDDANYPPISYDTNGNIVTLPLGRELHAYLNGYSEICIMENYGESRDVSKYNTDTEAETDKIIDYVDIGRYNVHNFNYARQTRIICKHGLTQLKADFAIPPDDPNYLSGLCFMTNEMLQRHKFKIKTDKVYTK